MKKLRIVLQSKLFFSFFIFLTIVYSLLYIFVVNHQSVYTKNTKHIEGIITSFNINGDSLSLELKAKEKIVANYRIKSEIERKNLSSIKLGDTMYLDGEMVKPNKNTIPNTFNYRKYLYHEHIYYTFKIDNYRLEKNNHNKIKNYIINRIGELKTKDYVSTFILGDKKYLDKEIYSNYQSNGVSHLFAISGMHISLLASVIILILKKFKYNYIIVIIVLWLYAFLTNFSSSVLRATSFITIIYLNRKYQLSYSTIKCLIISICLIILNEPFIIFKLGFQYSSIVTLGLIMCSKKITGNYFVKLLKVSCYAILFSLPISIYNYYEINLFSIISNLIFVPLITFIYYPLAILTFIFPIFDNVYFLLIKVLESINNYVASIDMFKLIFAKISFTQIILYYILFILWLNYSKKCKYLLFILIVVIYYKPNFNSNYYVYYLDVGQGDCSLLVSPHQKQALLIDTGGVLSSKKEKWQIKNTTNYMVNNLVLFFKSLGLKKLDYMIISHGDYDHMGEAINLVNNFKVEKVIFNCGPYNDLENELIKVLYKKKIDYYSCISELNIDKNKLYFLQTKDYDNENDNSNVIYTELNGYKFMFMGDASVITEKEIIDKYNLPDIDVLKVGHHGSKTSSGEEFIEEINPRYSIISVGKNNRYGHPNKEVLDNLNNSKIYRTDEDGSIMFKIKNNKLKIETCSP